MENSTFDIKTIEAHRNHFIERIKERYNIELTESEYNELYKLYKEDVKVFFAKNGNRKIGIVKIHDVDVCILYDKELGIFVTCYPSDVFISIESMIRACFGKGSLGKIANQVYNIYLDEDKKMRFDFETEKEAGLFFYSNEDILFSKLHMMKYKHGVIKMYDMVQQINSIIKGKHPRLKLSVIKHTHIFKNKKSNKENQDK